MKACMESAVDGTARTACKGTIAKAALASTLGKQASDVTQTELNKVVADAAKDQVHFVLLCNTRFAVYRFVKR